MIIDDSFKKKFWRVTVGITILVMAGVNYYLFRLRNDIKTFMEYESQLSNKRVENIREFRQLKPNPQP